MNGLSAAYAVSRNQRRNGYALQDYGHSGYSKESSTSATAPAWAVWTTWRWVPAPPNLVAIVIHGRPKCMGLMGHEDDIGSEKGD